MSMDTIWTLPLYPPTVCVFFLHLLTKNNLTLGCLFCLQSIQNRKILFGQIQTTNYLKTWLKSSTWVMCWHSLKSRTITLTIFNIQYMRRDTQYSVRWRVIWRDKTQTLQQYIRITVKKVQVKCPASRLYPQQFPTITDSFRR